MNDQEESKFYRVFLRGWRPFFWLATIIFAVYCAALFSGLAYLDDNVIVTGQYQFNRNLANIPQAFVEDVFRTPNDKGTFYRPIMRLSLMLDAQFGEEPLIFISHLDNICLHIFAILLFFVLLLKLGIKKGAALLFSALAAVHPLMAQAVDFIPGRNDTLLAIFIFSSFILFLDFLHEKKLKYFIWHLVFFVLAVFTKEAAIVLPFICAAYLLVFAGWKKIAEDLPSYSLLGIYWAGLAVSWLLVRKAVLGDFVGNADYKIILSVFNNLPSLIPAIGKIFLPVNLAVFPILADMTMIYGFIVIIILAIWFFTSSKKEWKFIVFGFLWFFGFIFFSLAKPAGSIPEFSEHRLYLPLFGFFFVIYGLGKSKLSDRAILAISLLVIIIFSSVTIYRHKYYRDNISFWNNAVATSPHSAFNLNNLGAMYYLEKDLASAEKSYRQALALNDSEPMVHNNLGLVYLDKGDYGRAEKEFKKELAFYPNYDRALLNLGDLYYDERRFDEAGQLCREALAVNPQYYEAYECLRNLQNKIR